MLYRLAEAIRDPGRAVDYAVSRFKEALLWEQHYAALRDPKVRASVTFDDDTLSQIADNLRQHGLNVVDLDIDVASYQRYLGVANYSRYWPYYDGGRALRFIEKSLEHYLAAALLELRADDVCVDIANDNSPVPEIYHHLAGCTVYRQDLRFPPGINGNRIGGDAAALPVESGFATKLALHCSFEHFEGNSDTGFIQEANRVLRPGGRLCIVPLYLHRVYAVQTNPALIAKGGIAFDPDAVLHCVPGWRNRHCRYYDVQRFLHRIVANLGDLKLTIYVVRNQREIHPSCYVKFVALLEKGAPPNLGARLG